MQNEAATELRRSKKLELIAVIGLGIATLFNAFAAFQSSQHSGAMNYYYTQGASLVNQLTMMQIICSTQIHDDRIVYMRLFELEQAVQSAAENSDARQEAERAYTDYRERFVHENLEAAIEWSKAHYADTNEYLAPEESPAYQEELFPMIFALAETIEQAESQGNRHNAVSDQMLLTTVFYTAVMFLLGMCGSLNNWKHKVAILIFSAALFAVATVMMARQPFFPDAEKAFMELMADFVAKYGGG